VTADTPCCARAGSPDGDGSLVSMMGSYPLGKRPAHRCVQPGRRHEVGIDGRTRIGNTTSTSSKIGSRSRSRSNLPARHLPWRGSAVSPGTGRAAQFADHAAGPWKCRAKKLGVRERLVTRVAGADEFDPTEDVSDLRAGMSVTGPSSTPPEDHMLALHSGLTSKAARKRNERAAAVRCLPARGACAAHHLPDERVNLTPCRRSIRRSRRSRCPKCNAGSHSALARPSSWVLTSYSLAWPHSEWPRPSWVGLAVRPVGGQEAVAACVAGSAGLLTNTVDASRARARMNIEQIVRSGELMQGMCGAALVPCVAIR